VILNRITAALSTSFILNHAPNSPSWMHWLQDLWSVQQHEHESWVKKIEEIKQLVEFRQYTNTAFEWKMWFSCFLILPGSAEAQVIWGDIVKRLFDFCQKISKFVHMCQSYSKPKLGRFSETQCNISYMPKNHPSQLCFGHQVISRILLVSFTLCSTSAFVALSFQLTLFFSESTFKDLKPWDLWKWI